MLSMYIAQCILVILDFQALMIVVSCLARIVAYHNRVHVKTNMLTSFLKIATASWASSMKQYLARIETRLVQTPYTVACIGNCSFVVVVISGDLGQCTVLAGTKRTLRDWTEAKIMTRC